MQHVIEQFDPLKYPSPLAERADFSIGRFQFVEDHQRIHYDISVQPPDKPTADPVDSFELAGPRRRIYFDPARTRAAIVTCGGLCPGLNDVIRGLVMELYHWYGVSDVVGLRYGYEGLTRHTDCPPQPLTLDVVRDIHHLGGTLLGSSRGPQDVSEMVEQLDRLGINLLFCIGGDGTLTGAHLIAGEIRRRNLRIAVIGIPKTIDNDIAMIYRSFGFQTAVEEATKVLRCAHVEARSARGGIGLVRLMGRDSGFIAAHATLASGDVNYCLIPECPFQLDGERGLLNHLRHRLRERRHAVIAVAEGAGAELLESQRTRDASGNIRHGDIGLFLKDTIVQAFAEWGDPVTVKYFDPSYIIRSVPANSDDSVFCSDMARCAVHAGMAGKTNLLIGQWHGVFTHVPLSLVVGRRKKVDTGGNLWRSVLAITGQPGQWT